MKTKTLLFVLTAVFLCLWSGPHAEAAPEATPLQRGYSQVMTDLQGHFWDPNYKIPRIRPTRGDNSSPTVLDIGTVDNNGAFPMFWQMAEYANVQYWNWKITHSKQMKADIQSQWNYVRSFWSDEALSSAKGSSLIINASDDAAWEINYLCQVHEVTGDPRALIDAEALLPNILDRFADPNAPRVNYGALQASPYGLLYATPGGDPGHQGISTSYEIMIANCALYLYGQTHNADYLHYAMGTYDWIKKYLKHPMRGYYYCELDIQPTVDGKKNPHYLVPNGDFWGPPVRGLTSSYSGATLAMAVAAARLYRITGERKYLREAQIITSDYVRPNTFLRPGNIFVNERDPWTNGHWAPNFAEEVLTLPGVDFTGLWKKAIKATALAIIKERTPDGYYGADWSGPEPNVNNKATTWIEQAQISTGSGRGMALPQQIMTSATSAGMVTAAEIVELRAHHQ